MSMNQLNVLVSLMITMALLVGICNCSESRDAQTNGYSNQKPATVPQKYFEMKSADYPFAFDFFPFLSRARTHRPNGPFTGRRYRRDLFEECCRNMCSKIYCPIPSQL